MTSEQREELAAVIATAITTVEKQYTNGTRKQVISIGVWQFVSAMAIALLGFAFQTGVLVSAVGGRLDMLEKRQDEILRQCAKLDDRLRTLEMNGRRQP